VALRPQSPGAHLNLGVTLKDKGKLDEALAQFQEAIRLKSDYAEAHVGLGVTLARKGKLEQAIGPGSSSRVLTPPLTALL